MRQMKVAVIGTGAIAENIHIHSLKEMDDITISAVCDINYPRAKAFANKWDIPNVYESHISLLQEQEIDAAVILVWPDQLFRIAKDCLNAGIHCFIEKPAGITLFQAESLLEASQKSKALLQVGFNRRHIPLMTKVIEAMKNSGPINQIEGAFFKHGSASFYDGCADAFVCDTIHALDIVAWLADAEPKSAALTAACYGTSGEENAWNGIIRFQNGITGLIKANYQTGGRVHSFEIHRQHASAYINLGFGTEDCEADIIFTGQKSSFSISAGGADDVKILHLDGKEIAGSDKYHRYYGYYNALDNFFKGIRGEAKLVSSIESAVKSMALVEFLRENEI